MGHDSEEGYRGVVNLDLETCFARVNHAMGMSRVARKVTAKRLLKLLRRDLNAGILPDGLGSQREAGMPPGSPRSPLRSKGLVDDVDQELEGRGHRVCRDADDANVDVRSQRAGDRVRASLTRFLEERLRRKGNRSTSGVDRPWHGTCLGDTVTNHLRPRVKPAPRSVTRAKERRRQITPQGRGRHIRTVLTASNRFTRGGVGYCRRSTVKHPFAGLDRWRRRR